VSPGLVIGILVLAVALALGGLVLERRTEGGWWKDPGRAAGVLGAARGPFAVILASVTIVMVGGLILIWFLSHPFRDQMGSIKPSSMERTLDELQTDPTFRRESSLALHCDAEGRPSAAATS
jgi:hypothetical protein